MRSHFHTSPCWPQLSLPLLHSGLYHLPHQQEVHLAYSGELAHFGVTTMPGQPLILSALPPDEFEGSASGRCAQAHNLQLARGHLRSATTDPFQHHGGKVPVYGPIVPEHRSFLSSPFGNSVRNAPGGMAPGSVLSESLYRQNHRQW